MKKVRISWNSWPLVFVDSNCATSVFVLGLVRVCLFCAVVFCLFRNNNSIVDSSFAEAMVYQRSWKLEDGKRYHYLLLSSTWLELSEFFLVPELKNERTVVWSLWHFCMPGKVSEKECHVERGCENCAPQGWPQGWPPVRDMSFPIVIFIVKFFCAVWCTEDWWTTVYMLLERPVHLYCIMTTLPYSPSMVSWIWYLQPLWRLLGVSDRCWPGMWCIGRFCTLFRILPESGAAYTAWAEDTYVGSTLRSFSMSLTTSSLDSSNDENIQLRTLG